MNTAPVHPIFEGIHAEVPIAMTGGFSSSQRYETHSPIVDRCIHHPDNFFCSTLLEVSSGSTHCDE
jgi:hypothetical protein